MALVKAGVVVLDCAEPEKLALFYRELLEAEQIHESANRVEIRSADGTRMGFRRDMNATAPSWPRPENSLQVHLDFVVDDLDEAERRVIGLGGRALDTRDTSGPFEERSYSDPAGHSFTLRRGPSTAPKRG
ncbi:hypothetical protein GA0115233_104637 [Streptomyces sp. DI166]|uniref:VOC family protein n=1 Tax=unclassified Streptomyces TaxID=2593676 RepID=UPI0007F52364|nr:MULTISPECIES: VOC family protein [unclassified Streptomyces]SBT92520.1 hypothetical protein GA0115233_104637 [Streptomyces sp. DI166]